MNLFQLFASVSGAGGSTAVDKVHLTSDSATCITDKVSFAVCTVIIECMVAQFKGKDDVGLLWNDHIRTAGRTNFFSAKKVKFPTSYKVTEF
jgi:hypothetical protein